MIQHINQLFQVVQKRKSLYLVLAHIVKVPRLRDSEGTFSVFRVKLPPVTTSLITQM